MRNGRLRVRGGLGMGSKMAREIIPEVVLVTILLSPFSLLIFSISSHYIFEIPLAISAIYVLLSKSEIAKVIRVSMRPRKPALFFYSVIAFMFVVGCLNEDSFSSPYGDFRANVFAVVGYLVCATLVRNDPSRLIRLCSISSVLYAAYFFVEVVPSGAYDKFQVPYFSVVIATVLAIWMGKHKTAAAFVFLMLFFSAVGFYRQYWAISGLLVLYFLTGLVLRSRRSARWLLVSIPLLIVAVLFIYPVFQGDLSRFYSSGSHYYQTAVKTRQLYSALVGESGHASMQDHSDSLRFGYFVFMAEYWWKLLVPHGLGYRDVYGHLFPSFFGKFSITANTIDSLAFYLSYHYGIESFIALFLWAFVFLIGKVIKHRGFIDGVIIFLIIMVPTLFDGGQVVVILSSFWLGGFLAVLANPMRKHGSRLVVGEVRD